MRYFLTLKSLQVTEAAVHAGFYTAGLPGLTAFAGFAHALQRQLCEALSATAADDGGWGGDEAPAIVVEVLGVCPVITTYALARGPARRVNSEHGLSGNKAASAAFDPLADLGLDIVLHVETSLPMSELQRLVGGDDIATRIETLRLSGGTIFWDHEVGVHATLAEALAAADRTGFVLEDASTVFAEALAEGGESAVTVLDRLTARPTAKTDDDGVYRPRFIAVATGFRALEPATVKRAGARFGAPHRFVEPVVGLARVRLVASAARALALETPVPVLWAHTAPTASGYYLVRAAVT